MRIKRIQYCVECEAFSTVDEEEIKTTDRLYLKSGSEMIRITAYTKCKHCNKSIPLELDLDDKYEV